MHHFGTDLCVMLNSGPIQYDAAVDPEIAKQKIKTHSEVAGQANVCIFPDLNTGNNTYKVRLWPLLLLQVSDLLFAKLCSLTDGRYSSSIACLNQAQMYALATAALE